MLAFLGDAIPPKFICILVLFVGLAYGAAWAIMPAHMACELGSHRSGVGFAVAAMSVAPVSSLFSTAAGYFYDAEAEMSARDSNVCIGIQCFRVALTLSMSVCVFSGVLLWNIKRFELCKDSVAETHGEL